MSAGNIFLEYSQHVDVVYALVSLCPAKSADNLVCDMYIFFLYSRVHTHPDFTSVMRKS